MSRDKQIEEMAELICDNKDYKGACSIDGCVCDHYCESFDSAEALYNAGYRKASEVAEDIIRILRAAGINEHRYPVIAELKKKYTEDGE